MPYLLSTPGASPGGWPVTVDQVGVIKGGRWKEGEEERGKTREMKLQRGTEWTQRDTHREKRQREPVIERQEERKEIKKSK